MDITEEEDIFGTLTLLIEWQVSQAVQEKFMDCDVELKEFLSMSLTQLKDYVTDPKERLHIANKIAQYKKQKIPNISYSSTSLLGNSTNSVESEEQQSPDPDTHSKSAEKPSERTTDDTDESTTEVDEQAVPSVVVQKQTPIPARLQQLVNSNKFKDFDLRAYLRANPKRSVVLSNEKDGMLKGADIRKDLVHILAEYMLSVTTSPSTNDFVEIRGKIADLLPNENLDLYYIAPQEHGPHQALARGMLFSKVRNEISKLIRKKVIEPRRKRRTPLGESSDTESNADEPAEITGLLVMLRRARELNAEVEANWFKTAEVRVNQLYSAARKQSKRRKRKAARENESPDLVSEYFNNYKLLRQPNGYVLLQLDFKHLHADEVDNLFSSWSEFLSKIEQLAVNSKIDDEVGKELVAKLKSDTVQQLDENNKDALLIQLLPSLCPPTARVIVGKQTFKPTTTESRDAFISHTTVGAGLEPLMKKMSERRVKQKASLQPYMIFVGPTRWDIQATYVVIDDIIFKPDNVMKCVDISFKSFHSLCAGYPKEANHIWHIFHLHLYSIKHDNLLEGEVPMSTNNFLAKLNDL